MPVFQLVQHVGDYVISCSGAAHGGFNMGFNVAEAVNAAPGALPVNHHSTLTPLHCAAALILTDFTEAMDLLGAQTGLY